MNIINFLDINNTFFTVIGYQMSYIEFIGTILNIWSVYLVSKNKSLNWPVGVVASLLFLFLFWQIQLYSDFLEQIYYVITGIWGWVAWTVGSSSDSSSELKVTSMSNSSKYLYALLVLILTACLGYFMSNISNFFPKILIEPASYPYLDALTTVLSFVATYFLIIKKVEAWSIWIVVDLIGIWLYFVKDVKFLSLLYVVFLVLAVKGLINWRSIISSQVKIYEK